MLTTAKENGMSALISATEDSLQRLASNETIRALEASVYWPKWDGPWWRMHLLAEMGLADSIPTRAVDALARGIEAFPYREFPLRQEDIPDGVDEYETFCHCMLGTVMPLLAKCGVDVDARFAWVRDWFARYQMGDGGLNCDGSAYLAKGETPSSMVGTVAPLRAMLMFDALRSDETTRAFVDAAGEFLLERKLVLGSCTKHNAEEGASELDWRRLTFPRFYFYDVLDGLDVLTLWAEQRNKTLPRSAFAIALEEMERKAYRGPLVVERQPWLERKTKRLVDGVWVFRQPAATFSLLDEAGRLGVSAPALAAQWDRVRARLQSLAANGRISEN